VRVRSGVQVEPEAETAAEGQEALEAAQAELEVAQAALRMRVELLTLAAVGEEGPLGHGIEGGHGHDQAESVDLGRPGQGTSAYFPMV